MFKLIKFKPSEQVVRKRRWAASGPSGCTSDAQIERAESQK